MSLTVTPGFTPTWFWILRCLHHQLVQVTSGYDNNYGYINEVIDFMLSIWTVTCDKPWITHLSRNATRRESPFCWRIPIIIQTLKYQKNSLYTFCSKYQEVVVEELKGLYLIANHKKLLSVTLSQKNINNITYVLESIEEYQVLRHIIY